MLSPALTTASLCVILLNTAHTCASSWKITGKPNLPSCTVGTYVRTFGKIHHAVAKDTGFLAVYSQQNGKWWLTFGRCSEDGANEYCWMLFLKISKTMPVVVYKSEKLTGRGTDPNEYKWFARYKSNVVSKCHAGSEKPDRNQDHANEVDAQDIRACYQSPCPSPKGAPASSNSSSRSPPSPFQNSDTKSISEEMEVIVLEDPEYYNYSDSVYGEPSVVSESDSNPTSNVCESSIQPGAAVTGIKREDTCSMIKEKILELFESEGMSWDDDRRTREIINRSRRIIRRDDPGFAHDADSILSKASESDKCESNPVVERHRYPERLHSQQVRTLREIGKNTKTRKKILDRMARNCRSKFEAEKNLMKACSNPSTPKEEIELAFGDLLEKYDAGPKPRPRRREPGHVL